MKTFLAATAACLVLSGCTAAEWDSINRQFTPGMGDSRLIDAKQMAVISVVDMDGKYLGTCAEPSPDAIQATATALSGSANLSKGDIEAAFKAAAGVTGSVASIGLRTQSIQLLRDAYYRLCEGHLTGGIDDIGFAILQQRFQNHMIALLAIEQLTGAVVASQVTISTKSDADAGGAVAEIGARLRSAQETLGRLNAEKVVAEQALATATAEVNAAITGGTTGKLPFPEHVTLAVAAITLNAINQDVTQQQCFEVLRPRVVRAEGGKIEVGPITLEGCKEVFKSSALRLAALNEALAIKYETVAAIARGAARGQTLSADAAVALIRAIDAAIPDHPAIRFLPKASPVPPAEK